MSESQSTTKNVGTDAENHTNTSGMNPEIKQFLLEDAPETVGGELNDTARIRETIEAAVDYYHSQLPDYIRDLITLKWGIKNETIDELKIGWTGEGHGLISHLQQEGFHRMEIIRAGLGSSRLFKHVYECDPDSDECYHDFDSQYDALARARHQGDIRSPAIDMYAVHDQYTAENDFVPIRDWWDNRIVFPYKNEDGEHTYMIGRETHATDDRPGKYLKQTSKKDYINTDAVYEPMYGVHTVEENAALLLTEGITDAIMAHQEGYNCISPVTKVFKKAHYPQLLEYAERASGVIVVNDNEESGEGIKGALDTAIYLRKQGVNARIGVLPRNDDEEKVDLAEFLRTHKKSDLNNVLTSRADEDDEGSMRPEDHPFYEEMEERERERLGAEPGEVSSDKLGVDNVDSNSNTSAIYEAKLNDVMNVKTGYRGDHPIQHHGNSHSGYFVVYEENGEKHARDFKKGYNYNALTWLAVASGARRPSHPEGKLDEQETWEVWKYAKEQGYIPEDDPVPARAMWHIARTEDCAPSSVIPSSMDDPKLPATNYNDILDTIEGTYALDPGRNKLHTDDE